MALFNSMTRTMQEEVNKTYMEKLKTPPSPANPHRLIPRREPGNLSDAAISEYREVAEAIGVSSTDLQVEVFKAFLHKHDLPTFNLQEVVKYMDDIAAKDNPTGLGWHWCPVREKDAKVPMTWGKPSQVEYHRHPSTKTPASDFYESNRFQEWHRNGQALFMAPSGFGQLMGAGHHLLGAGHQHAPSPPDWRTMPSPVYTRTIPLHALKKIALIEKNFTPGGVVFLVTDYTTAPHVIVNPDPFLMAVIPNSAVAHGKGRFIIDVWDEPGFGLDKQLIPAS